MITTLASRGRETGLIDLRLLELAAGERAALRHPGEELCAVVLEGAVAASVAGSVLGTAARRHDVFESPGDAAYAPPGLSLELEALSRAVVAVAAAPVDGAVAGPARVIRAGEQPVRAVGVGNWSRTIRTVLGPDDQAGRLLVGETINPPGNWSSYPPHKHDRQAPPEEVALEEVYFYRLKPARGFAVQLVYDGREERAQAVRDGDVVTIRSGYHPVVAAPGYALYYLWVMAGETRQLVPFFDPQHAWVQESAP
jgi:5-deoxy-glucuronate isomerase